MMLFDPHADDCCSLTSVVVDRDIFFRFDIPTELLLVGGQKHTNEKKVEILKTGTLLECQCEWSDFFFSLFFLDPKQLKNFKKTQKKRKGKITSLSSSCPRFHFASSFFFLSSVC